MGVPSLNDLAVDGTLNTTNQPIDISVSAASKTSGPSDYSTVPLSSAFDLHLPLMNWGNLSNIVLCL